MADRVGIGYDAHRLVDDRPLVLGGVGIHGHPGLAGHSDADVLAHAIMDAILGAATAGDIGALFPDSDVRFKGASSITLLGEVAGLTAERGWRVANIDSVVICESPRISDYRAEMTRNIAQAVGVDEACVSVKGTTCEGMGFTGRGEGIAAQAVVLMERAGEEASASPSGWPPTPPEPRGS